MAWANFREWGLWKFFCKCQKFYLEEFKLYDTMGGTACIDIQSNKFKGTTYSERKQVVLETGYLE